MAVNELLSKANIQYFALTPVWANPDRWRIFIPSLSPDSGPSTRRILSMRKGIIIDHVEVIKTERDDGWLHEIIFAFTAE